MSMRTTPIARQNSEQSREVFQTGYKVDGHASLWIVKLKSVRATLYNMVGSTNYFRSNYFKNFLSFFCLSFLLVILSSCLSLKFDTKSWKKWKNLNSLDLIDFSYLFWGYVGFKWIIVNFLFYLINFDLIMKYKI